MDTSKNVALKTRKLTDLLLAGSELRLCCRRGRWKSAQLACHDTELDHSARHGCLCIFLLAINLLIFSLIVIVVYPLFAFIVRYLLLP